MVDSYPQFEAWLASLDDRQRTEVLAANRVDELPPWIIDSLQEYGLVTVEAEVVDGCPHVVHLMTSRMADRLETIRSLQ